MTGHLLGAAGAIESVAIFWQFGTTECIRLLTTRLQILIAIWITFRIKHRIGTFDVAISNTFGFGGHNACLLLENIKKNSNPPHVYSVGLKSCVDNVLRRLCCPTSPTMVFSFLTDEQFKFLVEKLRSTNFNFTPVYRSYSLHSMHWKLFLQALLHRSYLFSSRGAVESNETAGIFRAMQF